MIIFFFKNVQIPNTFDNIEVHMTTTSLTGSMLTFCTLGLLQGVQLNILYGGGSNIQLSTVQ